MDTATVLCIVGLLLRISVAVPAHSLDESDLSMASVVVKEGESAEISCTMKESNVAYSWLKGGSLENSTVVASFISGITVNDPDDPFTVTENGTLIIKKVSRNDEGNYICRVSSEEISCHGDVFVLVQAVLQDFQLTIEYCEPENSCVISTESTKPTSLTCKATNASPSMKLKWFNGSREIKDNIEENSLTKGTSKEISSTIKDVYKAPSTLTCQAVDFKTSNDDGMFAHVQFRTSASSTDISPGWMVTAILFIVGFVILFLLIIFITAWPKVRNGKDVETQNSPERVSLLKSNNERLEANLRTRDDEIKSKNDEITIFNTNLQIKDDEIKKKSDEITELNAELMETNADKRVNQSNVTNKDTELKDKRDQILKLETNLQTKDDEIKKMSDEIIKLNAALTETKADKRVNESNVTSKDTELKDKREQILILEGASKSKDDQIKTKNEEIVKLKGALKSKDDQIKTKNEEIANLKGASKSKDDQMKTKNEEIVKLKGASKSKDDQIKTTNEEIAKLKYLEQKAVEIKSQHTSALIKEQDIKNEENKFKESYRKLENSERIFRAKKLAELETTTKFCGMVPLKRSKTLSVKMDGKESSITSHGMESKFSHIFNIGDDSRDTFERMSDFVENAIDGGQSCVIAFGSSNCLGQLKTMYYGENAIIPLSYKKILERSIELKHRFYTVNVKARLVHSLEDSGREIFIFKGEKDIVDKCREPKYVGAVDVNEKETMERLLKDHLESQQETNTKHNCFVEFIIDTTEHGQETARTGKITFATLFGIEMINKCFLMESSGSNLAQYLSKSIRDPNSKSLLLVHLNEDRDDVREILKVTGQITGVSKEKKVLRKVISR